VAVRPGTGGVELLDERGNWWLVEAPGLSSPHHPALREPSGWLMGMTAAAGILLIGFALWHRKRGRLSLMDSEKESERKVPFSVQFVARQLQPKAGCTIEVQELDDLLGLAGLETDETRRSRRNRAINDVNDWSTSQVGVEWIRRLRDPNDRRRGLYHISQELADLDFSNSAD
jgi:hypothetical protein